MKIGIDYSMTSPAVCVYDDSKGQPSKNNLLFFFLNDKKKYDQTFGSIIKGMKMPYYESQMERFDIVSDWAMSIVEKFNPDNIWIEGYSMGSKGRVFHIAENGGILKHKLYKAGFTFSDNLPPTSVKKHFCGKGNAGKEDMHDAFEQLMGIDVAALLDCKKDKSPAADVVDSFAMVKYGTEKF